ncbi:coiled-coil and C2 domain-containing protein 2A isoform X1 [Ostrinia furnacalis]|uniref:coiled-coil and C2 domain-containing protein 2A isoform X1 n=1 Tax=Ostrinia furnacalis TaxID=93504 RepID=UPI00103D09B9|nr:coiled-coil and C2 domain-containing protein 2A isoform X1 [Ostrinia furnacalis]
MGENIELQSFSKTGNDSDIEEYHEINQENLQETVLSQENYSPVNEYDFFTKYESKSSHKVDQKKKKKAKHKREKEPNLIDIINTELASVAVPVSENIITMVDVEEKERNYSYLVRTPSTQSLFRKSRPLRLDSEYGWSHQQKTTHLSPIFPRVLEYAITEEHSIPVQYVDPVQFQDLASGQNTDDEQSDTFLDITIKDIIFIHHHLFPLETMLCAKLVECYDEYSMSQIKLKELNKDIRVNRETRDTLKQDFIKISPNKKEDIRFDKTLRKYTSNILKLKEEYRETIRRQKKIIHRSISLWSDIEMIRDKTGHVETPYLLEIVNKDLDETKFEEEWTDAYNEEFNDMLDKIEYEYVTKYMEYKESKLDENDDSSERKKKPKLKVDEEEMKAIVEEIVGITVTRDKIDMILKKDTSILSDGAGKDTSKFNYNFTIYVDEVFVCQSETYTLVKDSLFEVQFTESFSVQILPKNEVLTIVLSENNEEVSTINIFLYEIKQNTATAEYIDQLFVYKNMVIQPNQKYVGSGHNIKEIIKGSKMRLKSSNQFEGNLQTTCKVGMKMGWNEKLSQNQSEIFKESMDIGRKLKRLIQGIDQPNVDSLRDIIGKIYGKDIGNNDKVTTVLQNLCKSKIKTDDKFAVDENDPEFIRLKLLHLRNIGEFTNVQNKLVPLHASQISTELLNCLQKSNDKDIDVEYITDKYAQMDPIELQRFIGNKYVEKLNENMLKNLHEHLMKKTQKDVVRDYRELSLRSFFSSQSSIGTIAALPRSTKQQYLNVSIGQDQEIHLTVLRAFNLMDRSSVILSEENEDDNCTIAGFKVRPLRPFVRLSYHGASVNTATAIGCHPTWNQTVKIKTKLQPLSSLYINIFDEYKANMNEGNSDDDNTSHGKTVQYRYSNRWLGTVQVPMHAVLTLGVLRGTFKISTPPLLFGYEVLQNKDSSQSLIPEVTQLLRKETSFISLQISTSLSHLGGLQGYNQPIPSSADDDSLIKHLNTTVTEYINDFPTRNIKLTFIDSSGRNRCVTQFLQPITLPSLEYFPKHPKSLREESALSKSSGFSKSSSSKSSGGRKRDDPEKSPGREESLYSGHDGSWKGDSQMAKMMNASLRYVSLIPLYEETESHVVTLMGVELLKVLIGSPLDHTILLASYFLYLGIKCWVVIGQGLPRGQSSYVLTQYDLTTRRNVLVTDQLFKRGGFLNKGDGFLWNVYDATTGERYELRDVSCPLKTVDYVFDNENIWLNVQSTQDCAGVSFDFTKTSNWLPVFNRTIFVMKQPLANDPSLYSVPADVTALRESLETKIKAKVQKWRPQLKTIWNRYCSGLLREMLPHWEYWTFNPSETKPGFSQRLKQLMVTYRVFGFPLNMAFARASSVAAAVKASALHASAAPDAEFALAVEVYAYPNNVLSVWVFLATISRI